MKIRIQKCNEDVKIPLYKTKGSAGLDFVANNFKKLYYYDSSVGAETYEDNFKGKDNILLEPNERLLVGTGLKMEIPLEYELQVRPRSGLALNDGLTVLNSPGTIDSDYRGEIGVILINNGNVAHRIRLGERIAQGVFNKVEQAIFIEDFLNKTERGDNGYGSTGV